MVDKVALGQVLSENFGFPCQSLFQQIPHHNHPGKVADVPGGPYMDFTRHYANLLKEFRTLKTTRSF
jgi:hypothetical protein